jgi:DHA1 family bicyclomycin/chloramphenicol resistance-like MFS transporter
LVAALIGLNSIALDIMLPALPEIGKATNAASSNLPQFTIGLFLLGAGLSALLIGPFADSYGRRPALLAGLAVFVAASFLAPYAPNLECLLALRFLQGLGVGATRVSQAMVRDSYAGDEMAEIFSLSLMAFLILPVIAPVLGQAILLVTSWHAIFFVMAALGAMLMAWVWVRLPETLTPAHRRPFSLAGIFGGLRLVLGDRDAMGYGLAAMFLLGALYGFINSAQQIYGQTFGLGALFPISFGAVAIIQSMAAYICSRLIRRLGAETVGLTSLLAFTGFAALLVIANAFGAMPFALFFVLIAAIMAMFTWADSTLGALSMKNLGAAAGTAASAFGALQAIGATILGSLIGQAYDGTPTALAFGYLATGIAALLSVAWGRRRATVG